MELTELTLGEAAKLIARRSISPTELLNAHLDRIERINPLVNCFITLNAQEARVQARDAEQAILHGEYRGPLHGIPIALKDVFETEGIRTTAGSKIFADHVPAADCTVVQKLKAAGAINLGKLNMYEWAMKTSNANPFFGACNNPWDLTRSPGGSSGGSAAALAASFCLGALGSDTGGSIRIPAALCAVVGLKPTYGRVSKQGVIPLSWSLDHVGPLARTVYDTAVLLQTIAGYDAADPSSLARPVDDYLSHLDEGIRGWRIAILYNRFFPAYKDADAEVLQAVHEAGESFRRLGASITECEFQAGDEAGEVNSLILSSEAATFHHDRMRDQPQDFGADVLGSLEFGASCTASEYILARQTQMLLRRQLEQLFDNYDLLLMPATPVPAPRYAEPDETRIMRPSLTSFTAPLNLAGLPAISLPCGFTHAGLPIGLQICAPVWGEARLLQAACAFERATPWHTRKPSAIP